MLPLLRLLPNRHEMQRLLPMTTLMIDILVQRQATHQLIMMALLLSLALFTSIPPMEL